MRASACLLLALPATALAHGEVPAAFEAPLGPGNVVVRGEAAVVRWRDTDLGDATISLHATRTPPPPRVSSWPLDQVEGERIHGPVPVTDPVDEVVLDTAALEPGHWFFWLGLEAPDGHTQYVPPAGVLTVVEPGAAPPPSVFFDAPARNDTAQGGAYVARLTTWPTEGIEVVVRAGFADAKGLDDSVAWVGRPGIAEPVEVDLRCVAPAGGWVELHATVAAPDGGSGAAWATGRLLVPANAGAPGDCPAPPGSAGKRPRPRDGAGCAAAGGESPLLALFLLLRRRR